MRQRVLKCRVTCVFRNQGGPETSIWGSLAASDSKCERAFQRAAPSSEVERERERGACVLCVCVCVCVCV